MSKTNAARLLEKNKIPFELVDYEVDESDLSAKTVARKIGAEIEVVFKTLVLRGDKTGIFVTIVPGDTEVDLKKAAKASGNKNAAMVAVKEILELTGYIRGGCSPLGMKKKYPLFIHESCLKHQHIYISAGVRGTQIKLAPMDLINTTGASIENIVL